MTDSRSDTDNKFMKIRDLGDKMEDKTHFNQGENVEYVNAKGETVRYSSQQAEQYGNCCIC